MDQETLYVERLRDEVKRVNWLLSPPEDFEKPARLPTALPERDDRVGSTLHRVPGDLVARRVSGCACTVGTGLERRQQVGTRIGRSVSRQVAAPPVPPESPTLGLGLSGMAVATSECGALSSASPEPMEDRLGTQGGLFLIAKPEQFFLHD